MTDSQDSKPAFGTQAYWRAELAACEERIAAEREKRGAFRYAEVDAYAAGTYKGLAESLICFNWPGDGDFAATIESES